MSFGARLQALRKAYGMTQEELGDRINKKKQSIYYYEHDRRQCDYETLKAFSHFFGVSVDYLIGNESPRDNRLRFRDESSLFVELPLFRRLTAFSSLLGPPDDFIPTWAEYVRGGTYFYYISGDDSMAGHRILNGDMLRVRAETQPMPGQVALVAAKEDVMLRAYQIIDGNAVLMPSNPRYSPTVMDMNSVRVFGVVETVSFELKSGE